MPANILVVEDEPAIQELLAVNLEHAGHHVLRARDAEQASSLVRHALPDLILLDWMLPGQSGISFAKSLRQDDRTKAVPIIMLTARGQEQDKIAGLESGADDYVTKPFSIRELVSRVRAHLRRARMLSPATPVDETLTGGRVVMDVARHEVRVGDEPVAFPPKEFELLETFLRRKGRLLTREFLIEEVWGTDYFGDTKTLDVHVKRIRRKVEPDPHQPRHLVTVRGLGYKFVD
jgi:two-component system phosphate regulon response regulator PhoB